MTKNKVSTNCGLKKVGGDFVVILDVLMTVTEQIFKMI